MHFLLFFDIFKVQSGDLLWGKPCGPPFQICIMYHVYVHICIWIKYYYYYYYYYYLTFISFFVGPGTCLKTRVSLQPRHQQQMSLFLTTQNTLQNQVWILSYFTQLCSTLFMIVSGDILYSVIKKPTSRFQVFFMFVFIVRSQWRVSTWYKTQGPYQRRVWTVVESQS